MDQVIYIIGIAGNGLLIVAYIPQIIKLITTKKGEDLSKLMWINYFIGDVLLAIYAFYTLDYIFAFLFTAFTIGNITILLLTLKYSKKAKLNSPI